MIAALQVDAATLQQQGAQIQVTIHTAQPWTAAGLTPEQGRALCVRFSQRGRQTRICPVPGTTAPLALRWSRLNADGHPVQSRPAPGRAAHPDPQTLIVRFTYGDAGLSTGRYSWSADGGRTGQADVPLPSGCVPHGPGEVFHGPAGRKRIALTFDDGPDTDTPQFVELLEREHVPATFFMVGRHVAGHAALLKRMLRDGDMIGNHSWAHTGNTGLAETNAAIRRATGFTPCLYRPPYGNSSAGVVSEVEGLGMRSIRWNVDPADWRLPGVGAIVANVLANARDGAIVISHDGGGPRGETLAAYAQIIPELERRGYQLVTVTDLLGYELSLPGAPSSGTRAPSSRRGRAAS